MNNNIESQELQKREGIYLKPFFRCKKKFLIIGIFFLLGVLVPISSAKNFNITSNGNDLFYVNGTSGNSWFGYNVSTVGDFCIEGGNCLSDLSGTAVDGIGSAGYVPYWTDSNTLGYDSGQFFWDASNNRLGIGTSSPENLLHVKVNDAGITPHTSANFVIEDTGTNYLQMLTGNTDTVGILFGDTDDVDVGKVIYDHNLNAMQFTQGGAIIQTIRDGNVGIGTTSPDTKLQVVGGDLTMGESDATDKFIIFQTSGSNAKGIKFNRDSAIDGSIIMDGSESITINYQQTDLSGRSLMIKRGSAGTDVAIFDSSGKVGIGTSSPARKLVLYNATNPIFQLANSATGVASTDGVQLQLVSSDTYLYNYENGFMSLGTNNTQILKLHASGGTSIGKSYIGNDPGDENLIISGNVGIGTTSPASLEGTNKFLNIAGTSAGIVLEDTTTNVEWEMYHDNDGDLRFAYEGGIKTTFKGDGTSTFSGGETYFTGGNVGIGTNSPYASLTISAANTQLGFIDTDSNKNWTLGTHGDNNLAFMEDNDGNKARLFLEAGGNVGIGTSSPGAKLDVVDSTAYKGIKLNDGTYDVVKISHGGTGKGYVQALDNGVAKVTIQANGDSYFNGGNVGIGTTSPAQKLDVEVTGNLPAIRFASSGIGVDTGGYLLSTQDHQAIIAGGTYYNGTGWLARATEASYTSMDNGDISFYADQSLTKGDIYTPTTRMFINGSTGNVGIGTTSPSKKLHVVDGAGSEPAYLDTAVAVFQANDAVGDAARIVILGGTSGYSQVQFADADDVDPATISYSHADDAMSFRVNASTRMEIQGDGDVIVNTGNVGIGTTSPQNPLNIYKNSGASLTSILNITEGYDGGNDHALILNNNNDRDIGITFQNKGVDKWSILNDGPTSSTGDDFSIENSSGTSVFMIEQGGNVGIGTTSPDGTLHVHTSSAGSVTPHANVDDLIIENAGHTGITILGGTTSETSIAFGDGDSSLRGMIVYDQNTDYMHLRTAGTTNRLTIDSSGNVGIGTTSPDGMFHVISKNNLNNVNFAFIFDNQEISATDSKGMLIKGGANSATTPTFQIQDYVGNADFNVMGDGKVGIGTSSPSAKLHIGTSTAGSWATRIDAISTAGSSYGLGIYAGTNSGDDAMRVHKQDGTELFRIRGDGNVGIGTTSPGVKLDIDAGSNTAGLRLRGLVETAEIADLYMGASGNLVISTVAGTDSAAYIDLRSEDDLYGIIIRESDGTSSASPYANLYVTDATDDYLSIGVNTVKDGDSLVVTAANKVGIGIATPTSKLHVLGSVGVNGGLASPGETGGMGDNINLTTGLGGIGGNGEFGNDNGGVGGAGGNLYLNAFNGGRGGTAAGVGTDGVGGSGGDIILTAGLGGTGSSSGIDGIVNITSTLHVGLIGDNTVVEKNLSVGDSLVVGKPDISNGQKYKLEIIDEKDADFGITQYTSDTVAGSITIRKADGTESSPSAIDNNDWMGSINFAGLSTTWNSGAGIAAYVDGTPSSGNVPGRIALRTSASGGPVIDQLVIKSNGDLLMTSTKTSVGSNHLCYDGSGSSYWGECSASSRIYKNNITDLNIGLNELMKLRPVTFNYKPEYDSDASVQIGFIAEEVDEVTSLLVFYKNNTPNNVKYEKITALNTKAIQEQQGQIKEIKQNINNNSEIGKLQKENQEMRTELDEIKKQIEELKSSGIVIQEKETNEGIATKPSFFKSIFSLFR